MTKQIIFIVHFLYVFTLIRNIVSALDPVRNESRYLYSHAENESRYARYDVYAFIGESISG